MWLVGHVAGIEDCSHSYSVLLGNPLQLCSSEKRKGREDKINRDIRNLAEEFCEGWRLMEVPRTMMTAELRISDFELPFSIILLLSV